MTFDEAYEAYFIEGQPVPENINAAINATYDPFLHTPGYLLGYPGYPTYQNIPLAPSDLLPIHKDKLDASVKEEKKKRRRKKLLKLMILSQMMNSNN